MAALVVTAGMGGQGFADPGTPIGPQYSGWPYLQNGNIAKVGLLNVSLNNQSQAFKKGATWGVTTTPNNGSRTIIPAGFTLTPVAPFQPWDTISYYDVATCVDQPTKYASAIQAINNVSLIKAINAAFSRPVTALSGGGLFRAPGVAGNRNIYQGASFTTSAKIVVINYENALPAPPYPPTEDGYYANAWFAATPDTAWNAPYNLIGVPAVGAPEGQNVALNWPNQNYIAWGKPFDVPVGVQSWIGNQVYIIDPNNANPFLWCFDVTPFFEFSEAYCFFCWDTLDRVTDGQIKGSSTAPPCSPISACGQTGNGKTKWSWTVKFNNIGAQWPLNPNFLIDHYYGVLLAVDPAWWVAPLGTLTDNGAALNNADQTASANALSFTVQGIATYSWAYKTLSTQVSAPMGTMSMTAAGAGYSPECGVFTGPVSLTEYDRSNAMFNNKITKSSVLCF